MPPPAASTASENRTTATFVAPTSSVNVGRTFSMRKTAFAVLCAALPARSLSTSDPATIATVTCSPPSAIPCTSRSICSRLPLTCVPVGVPTVAAPPATKITASSERSPPAHTTSSENVMATPLPSVSERSHDGRTFSISAAVSVVGAAALPAASVTAPVTTATDNSSEPSGVPSGGTCTTHRVDDAVTRKGAPPAPMPERLSWSASRGLPEKVATMMGSDHSSTAELFWRTVSATVGAVRSLRATE